MKRLGKNIACEQNSVCKSMSVKKHGFHVALHDCCAVYIVCVCVCVRAHACLCAWGGAHSGDETCKKS